MRFLVLVLGLLPLAPAVTAAPRPNIVVILADDLGYGDLGCYRRESKIPTPNLDRLAAEGLKFTQAYCPVSICTPTRYALMTGAYPWRAWNRFGVLGNWESPMIPQGQLTLPGMLKSAGYRTGGFGKWHLGATYATNDGRSPAGQGKFKSPGNGENVDLSQPIEGGPLDRGFDEWFGMICASELLVVDGERAALRVDHDLYEPLAIAGVDRLEGISLTDYLPRVVERCEAFIAAAAPAEQPFFLYFAPYVPHIPLTVAPEFLGKTDAGPYGDYVHQLDDAIGRLAAAIERTGELDDTLILFASDNGSQFVGRSSETNGHAPNAPLSGRKAQIAEGGTRTPLIVRWPRRVPESSATDRIFALNDVLATLAGLIGTEVPSGQAPDSLDQSAAFLKPATAPAVRTEVATQDGSRHFAFRSGDWKLVMDRKGEPLELFNLAADLGEETNVAAGHPEIVVRLKEAFAAVRGPLNHD